MSLKHIFFSVLFVLFSIYVAFLNPHESIFHLTQSQTFKLPMVILLFVAVFVGMVISIAVFWTFNLKNTFSRWKSKLQKNRNNKKHIRLENLFKKAENFFLGGRLEKALSITDKVLDDAPKNIDALSLKGKILFSQGEKVAAATFQKKALEQDPKNISIRFDLAKTYSEAEQYQEEINLLKNIHRDNPKAVQPLFNLRDAFLKKKDWKNVITSQDKIIPLIRDNKEEWNEELKNKSRFLYARGKQQWEQDKRDSALSDFKQALKTWNKNSDAHLFIGDAYLEIGKPKIAFKKWLNGFEQTQNISCLTRAQRVCLETGVNPQDLIVIYQKAIDLNPLPKKHTYILLLAVLFIELNQPDEAKNILQENQAYDELLGSLLLSHTDKSSNSEPNFSLLKDAILGQVAGSITS